ncbi:MAG: DMT family transporter [Nitrososphaerales archaeon]|nr:DMT family transporter [Nitrososphaerales archaeon]
MIEAIGFAILSAILFAYGTIFVRKGLEELNFFSASIVVTLIGFIIYLPLMILLVPLNRINMGGIVLFLLSGIFTPGLTRLFYFKGIEKLGAAINAPIFATHPLFSAILAFILLNEEPSYGIWLGIFCIICGGIILEKVMHNNGGSKRFNKIDALFPLSAAIVLGFGYILRKTGLNMCNEPIAGATFSYMASLLVYTLLFTLSSRMRSSAMVNGKGLQRFWKAGVLFGIGWVSTFYALRVGDVTIVAPLVNTEPLFVILFIHLFLRKLERVSIALVIGALFIVIGTTFIILY